MKICYCRNTILFFILLLFVFSAESQSFKINNQKSTITINGNTNVHSFKSKVTNIDGEFVINASKQVKLLEVRIPVESIKSGEKLMDKKTYETFNYEKFPTIIFQVLNSTIKISNERIIEVDLTGNLTMAGVKKVIRFKSISKPTNIGIFQFTGSIPLKLSDFKMKPPTFMLGAMRVFDDIVLKYDIIVDDNSNKL